MPQNHNSPFRIHSPRLNNVNGGPGVSQANVECSSASLQSHQAHQAQSHLQMVLQSGGRATYPPPSPAPAPQAPTPIHYANTPPPHHMYNNQPQ